MVQTVTQNSALSQNLVECTVHPTLAQPVCTGCAHCAQAAHTAPCRSARWAMSWPLPGRVVAPSPAVSQRCVAPLGHDTKIVLRLQLLLRAMSPAPGHIAGSVAARCCCIAACIAALIVTQGSPQATIQTIVSRLTPGQATRAHAAARPARGQLCRRLYRSRAKKSCAFCRAPQHALLGRVVAWCPCMSRYKTLYRDSTQNRQ